MILQVLSTIDSEITSSSLRKIWHFYMLTFTDREKTKYFYFFSHTLTPAQPARAKLLQVLPFLPLKWSYQYLQNSNVAKKPTLMREKNELFINISQIKKKIVTRVSVQVKQWMRGQTWQINYWNITFHITKLKTNSLVSKWRFFESSTLINSKNYLIKTFKFHLKKRIEYQSKALRWQILYLQ